MNATGKRREYEMTEDDLAALLDASKSIPLIAIHTGMSSSPQERANRAWAALGDKMGFDSMTVEPVRGKGNRFFTAIMVVEPAPAAAEQATPIPMTDCGLTINVGDDGTWLHFSASTGLHASLHVGSLSERSDGIIGKALADWCADRRKQATASKAA